MSDQGQRTEQPSQQKLRKARQDGRFPVSREFVASVQFLAFCGLAVGLGPIWWDGAQQLFRRLFALAFWPGDLASLLPALVQESLWLAPVPLLLGGTLVFTSGLVAQLACTGFGLAPAKLGLDVSRLNPAQRLGGLWSQNRRAALEAVVLLSVVAVVLWQTAAARFEEQLRLSLIPLRAGVAEQAAILGSLLWKASAFLLLWGAIDLVRSRRRYTNELKMTKQEVREEHKQSEGNPEIKMRIRRLRRELLRRRMMAQVAEATAVITNPTHYAVALKYELGSAGAPRVVAKGKNYLALRIREKAVQHQVPLVENPPLARALYKSADVGAEIPAHLYRAVAEVLAYVFRMLGRGPTKQGGS